MFNNSRYLTKGINEEVPLNLQILLWSMIDSTLIKKDYLQVFNIKITYPYDLRVAEALLKGEK